MKSKSLLYGLPVVFALLYFVLSQALPFWGDGIASVSKAAVRIYEDGLHRPWNYPDSDPGHGTLFPWLVALLWKIAGLHLWVPHALVAVCLFLLLNLLRSFLTPFEERLQVWGLLLIGLSPLTFSQAMEISLQLPLTLAFFAAVHALKKEIPVLFALYMGALVLLHVQGVLLIAALGFYDVWRSWPLRINWWKRFPLYLFPVFVFLVWCYFHQKEFGWALVTPNYPRAAPDLLSGFYNLGISAWRLLDLGYFILVIPVFYTMLKAIRKAEYNDIDRLFIPLAVILCVGIPFLFAYPPNHRYIFPVYLLLVPLFIRFLEGREKRRQWAWLSAALLLLVSGNLWHYPGKCLGDQNLVFLGYFKIERQMMKDLPEGTLLHSYAPLNNSSKYTWLKEKRELLYTNLYDKPLSELDWVVESNLNCEYTPGDRALLKEHFVARSYETYGVFVNLWMNKRLQPKFYNLEFNGPHQPGALEEFIQNLKAKLR